MSAPWAQTTSLPSQQHEDQGGFRRLPDGTVLDLVTNSVKAPLNDGPHTPLKRYPSPGGGGYPIITNPPAASVRYGELSGGQMMPGMGQEGGGVSTMRYALMVGAVIGVAALTVYLQGKFSGKKSKAKD